MILDNFKFERLVCSFSDEGKDYIAFLNHEKDKPIKLLLVKEGEVYKPIECDKSLLAKIVMESILEIAKTTKKD